MNNLAKPSFSQKAQALSLKAKNDKSAMSELILLYAKRIQAMVVSMACSPDDVSDLSQEGLMGLCDAVKNYDATKGTLFTTYANVCIRNNIVSALRKKPAQTDEITEEIQDMSYAINPEISVLDKVVADELLASIRKNLSDAELKIFDMYLQEMSYETIADRLGIGIKNVDNAMQRVRKKIKKLLNNQS